MFWLKHVMIEECFNIKKKVMRVDNTFYQTDVGKKTLTTLLSFTNNTFKMKRDRVLFVRI